MLLSSSLSCHTVAAAHAIDVQTSVWPARPQTTSGTERQRIGHERIDTPQWMNESWGKACVGCFFLPCQSIHMHRLTHGPTISIQWELDSTNTHTCTCNSIGMPTTSTTHTHTCHPHISPCHHLAHRVACLLACFPLFVPVC